MKKWLLATSDPKHTFVANEISTVSTPAVQCWIDYTDNVWHIYAQSVYGIKDMLEQRGFQITEILEV